MADSLVSGSGENGAPAKAKKQVEQEIGSRVKTIFSQSHLEDPVLVVTRMEAALTKAAFTKAGLYERLVESLCLSYAVCPTLQLPAC
jgi:hypothetical protein